MTKFVMLALVAFSLAACETATTDNIALRGDASRTVRHHKPMVRGPVVPDRVERATRSASAKSHVPRVVPNPLSRTASVAPGATVASTHSTVPQTAPSEPIQSTSGTESQPTITELPSEVAPAISPTMGAYPTHDSSLENEPSAPISLGLDSMTPDKIEAMFGGMPFLLIAAIAAALMATLGLALRRPARDPDDYAEHRDNVDHLDDHREPNAA